MPEGFDLHALVMPLALLLSQGFLAGVVGLRRGLRRRETGFFAVYLFLSILWLLFLLQGGLRAIWPLPIWDRLAPAAFLGMGVLFCGFTRAFLQKPGLPLGFWLPALLAAAILAAVEVGLIPLPSTLLTLDSFVVTSQMLVPTVAVVAAALYTGVAFVTILVEYIRRPSPLHRNRIVYWFFGALAVVAGVVLSLVARKGMLAVVGAAIHFLGAALFTYLVVQPQLLNVGTGVRLLLSYILTMLVPAVIVTALSVGLIALLGRSLLPRLRLTESVVLGLLVTGSLMLLVYQPLGALTRSVANRLFFGRGHEARAVVREYSQAVTQILSLEPLAETAMQIVDRALGIRRGTLLVVSEVRAVGWPLWIIEGLDVPAGLPPVMLPAGTPLAEWLVERGEPLHQYTLDVDPRFDSLGAAEREAWRQLGMEVFFPIKRSDAFIGLLAVGLRRSGRPYRGADLDLLKTLADQTAVALENASLFDSVQRRVEQLALLNEIGRVITASLDLGPAVNLIAERTESAFPRATGFIFLVDEARGELVLQDAFGRDVPDVGAFRIRIGQGLAGWVASERRPILVLDPSRDSRYSAEAEGVLVPGAEAAACVPIVGREGVALGSILVASPNRTGLGAAELNLLDSIASFASIAIDNARQVAAREAQLRQQVEALRIEVDEFKRTQHVAEITDTDYFRQLQSQVRRLRRSSAAEASEGAPEAKGVFGRIQQELDARASADAEEEQAEESK